VISLKVTGRFTLALPPKPPSDSSPSTGERK
jgi:hypothetical protein